MATTLKGFAADCDKLSDYWSGPKLKAAMTRVGEAGQKIAEKAASADLGGDPKFSHWKPPLVTEVKHTGPGEITIAPSRMSAGPWTVAESGRHGDFQGPGVNARTGRTARRKDGTLRKVRARGTAKRNSGTTRGKHTASDAVREMDRELPKAIDKEWGRAVAETLGRG